MTRPRLYVQFGNFRTYFLLWFGYGSRFILVQLMMICRTITSDGTLLRPIINRKLRTTVGAVSTVLVMRLNDQYLMFLNVQVHHNYTTKPIDQNVIIKSMYIKMEFGIFEINRLKNYQNNFYTVLCKVILVIRGKFLAI